MAKGAGAAGIPPKWLGAVAKELATNRGRALVVVGSRQPPALHAFAHALNAALGTVGTTLMYAPVADPDELDAATDLKALTDAMAAGQVETLVMLGGNPVYDAPIDLGFADKLGKVPFSAHASLFVDETSEKCTWHVPRAHEFESWGDAQALDGTMSVQQPLIAPLYAGRSDIELLACMAGSFAPEKTGHEAVRTTARTTILAIRGLSGCGPFDDMGKADCKDASGNAATAHTSDLEREWSRSLAMGIMRRPQTVKAPSLVPGAVAAALEKRKAPARGAGFEVTFAPCPKMHDGRHANNTWLQELPDPMTKIVWDNAARPLAGDAPRSSASSARTS